MKIFMRNIGMTLHVIHTLRREGIDNVQVNMDWQHLLMNGENLGEYVALLAAEGLLGHQHANSGWGTFDDDNMVGATAFMETVELALELRRAGYGRNGDERRLGFDLYPYTEDQVGAVRRSVLQWRFIDETAGKIDGGALRGGAGPQGRDSRLRAGLRGARRAVIVAGLDVGTTSVKGLALDTDSGEVVAGAEDGYPFDTPQARLDRAGPGALVAGRRAGARLAQRLGGRARRHRPERPDARARGARLGGPRAAPGAALERPAHRPGDRGDRGAAGRARRPGGGHGQPGADRVHRAEAALDGAARAGAVRAHRAA